MRIHPHVLASVIVVVSAVSASGCASRASAKRGDEVTEAPASAPPREPAPAAPDVRPQTVGAAPAVAPRPPPIYFAFDSWLLDASAREALVRFAASLPRDASVRVEGHADERGTTQYNVALGARRAEAVREYLVRLGVPADRLATISFGEERPAVPGSTDEAWARNRRAELDVTALTAATYR